MKKSIKKSIKKSSQKSGHRIALSVISSVILIIIIVSLVNVGLSIFFESPQYDDYCTPKTFGVEIPSKESCESMGGKWEENAQASPIDEFKGYCDMDYTCRQSYEESMKSYNQVRYYFFAVFGLILLLVGMYSLMHTLQYTGLGSGGVLLFEGIVTNFENKILVFVSLIIILAIFGFLVFKKIEKK